jgi:hypothetical protein
MSVKATRMAPSTWADEMPASNAPRVTLARQVPLTGGAVFHRVALDE